MKCFFCIHLHTTHLHTCSQFIKYIYIDIGKNWDIARWCMIYQVLTPPDEQLARDWDFDTDASNLWACCFFIFKIDHVLPHEFLLTQKLHQALIKPYLWRFYFRHFCWLRKFYPNHLWVTLDSCIGSWWVMVGPNGLISVPTRTYPAPACPSWSAVLTRCIWNAVSYAGYLIGYFTHLGMGQN